jgi:hypothetical protein
MIWLVAASTIAYAVYFCLLYAIVSRWLQSREKEDIFADEIDEICADAVVVVHTKEVVCAAAACRTAQRSSLRQRLQSRHLYLLDYSAQYGLIEANHLSEDDGDQQTVASSNVIETSSQDDGERVVRIEFDLGEAGGNSCVMSLRLDEDFCEAETIIDDCALVQDCQESCKGLHEADPACNSFSKTDAPCVVSGFEERAARKLGMALTAIDSNDESDFISLETVNCVYANAMMSLETFESETEAEAVVDEDEAEDLLGDESDQDNSTVSAELGCEMSVSEGMHLVMDIDRWTQDVFGDSLETINHIYAKAMVRLQTFESQMEADAVFDIDEAKDLLGTETDKSSSSVSLEAGWEMALSDGTASEIGFDYNDDNDEYDHEPVVKVMMDFAEDEVSVKVILDSCESEQESVGDYTEEWESEQESVGDCTEESSEDRPKDVSACVTSTPAAFPIWDASSSAAWDFPLSREEKSQRLATVLGLEAKWWNEVSTAPIDKASVVGKASPLPLSSLTSWAGLRQVYDFPLARGEKLKRLMWQLETQRWLSEAGCIANEM